MRRHVPLLLALVLLAACDGGDGESASTTSASTTTTAAPVTCPTISGGTRIERSVEPAGGPFRPEQVEVTPQLPGCLEQVVLTFSGFGPSEDDSVLGYRVRATGETELEVTTFNTRRSRADREVTAGAGALLVEGVRQVGRARWLIDLTAEHEFKVLVRGTADEIDLVVTVVQ